MRNLTLLILCFTSAVGCSNATNGDSGTIDDTSDTSTDIPYDSGDVRGPDVVINEFMAKNESTLADASGSFEDWIELYNRGDEAADLSGWTLSDDNAEPWTFPDDTTLDAGAFLLVWADEDLDETDGLHAGLKLGTDGDRIVLTPPSGEPRLIAWGTSWDGSEPGYPAGQEADVAYGRMADGGELWGPLDPATPGSSNAGR